MATSESPRSWLRTVVSEHWLPLLILIAPINVAVGVWTSQRLFLFVLVVPIVAFAIGLTLRPRHVWAVWLGSVVIVWVSMGLWGRYNDPGDESALSLILEAIIEMLIGVALPLWLGKVVRNVTSLQPTS